MSVSIPEAVSLSVESGDGGGSQKNGRGWSVALLVLRVELTLGTGE